MKLIYLTSKMYPSSFADNFFALEMARAFSKQASGDFLFVVGYEDQDTLKGIPNYSFNTKLNKGKRIYYFIRLPFFILRGGFTKGDSVFFSNDIPLLKILLFWKKVFGFNFKVVSDWHMLFGGENEAKVVRMSDGMITTTEHLKKLIVSRYGAPESKILTAYGGVNLDIFEKITESTEGLRKRLNLSINDFLVGYVGFYKTMGASKGLDTMIESLSLISDSRVKMVFVGGRPDEILEYSKLAEEKGVTHRVIFVPFISSEKLVLYEKAMDALVIPYPDKPHFREYGFPMKAYEYLASEKPILYSNLPIIAEVLDGCAVSFIPDNAKDLSEKILEIKNNPDKSKALIARALEKAKECTWDKRAQNIIDFIKSHAL